MSVFITLQQKISKAPSIDFSDLFNDTISTYKKVWLQGLLCQLINTVVGLPLLLMNSEVFSLETLTSNGPFVRDVNDQYFLTTPPSELALWFLTLFVTILISTTVNFGFFRIVKQIDTGGRFEFSDFFYFIKSDHIVKSILVILAYFGVALLATLMCVLPLFYVMIPLMFVPPMFAYNNTELSVSETIKLSFQLGHKKWGITFVITVLNGIFLYLITIFTCGLGSLFFGCIMQLPIYIIYKKTLAESLKSF